MKRLIALTGIMMAVGIIWPGSAWPAQASTAGSIQPASLVPPPDKPKGPSTGMAGQKLTYSTNGTDPFSVHYYMFDWGDGSALKWKSSDKQSHVYMQEGTYYIRAREKCPLEFFETDWSGTTKVVISGNVADAPALSVTSDPVSGVNIGGDAPGKTDYVVPIPEGTQVTLNAPSTATIQGAEYTFEGWVLDGVPQGAGDTELTITVDANTEAVAVYSVVERELVVLSDPIVGVQIDGDAPGMTNYPVEVPDNSRLTLTAPSIVAAGGGAYGFTGWAGIGSKIYTKPNVRVQVNSDMEVTATYGEIQMAVTYPTEAGIVLERGARVTISWEAVNLPKGTRIKVLLVKDGGSQIWTLSEGTTKTSVRWTVGKTAKGEDPYPDGDDYQIVVGTPDGAVMAESANPFAIASVQSLSLIGPTSVQGGADPMPQYWCMAHYSYGEDQDVTPLVKWGCSAGSYAKVRKGGLLATKEVASLMPLTILATYGKGDAAVSDGLDISLTP
jgi:hypothetical protein